MAAWPEHFWGVRRWRRTSGFTVLLPRRDRDTARTGRWWQACWECVRSFEIAEERGLRFSFRKLQLRDAHPNTAVLTVKDAEGKELVVQAASLGGGRIRVDKINGVDVNFTGAYNTLIVRHKDVAGELSRITNELAVGGVNIANMSVFRDRRGGDVLTVIETDQKLKPDVRERIRIIYAVNDVTYYEKEDA